MAKRLPHNNIMLIKSLCEHILCRSSPSHFYKIYSLVQPTVPQSPFSLLNSVWLLKMLAVVLLRLNNNRVDRPMQK